MKLLFDQNISFRILRLLPDSFANCRHIRSVGLNNCNDAKIWQYAKQNGFTIVTFDADFFDMSILRGFPPKIIWLRTGNLTTSEIAERIILNYPTIVSFIDAHDQNCLEITDRRELFVDHNLPMREDYNRFISEIIDRSERENSKIKILPREKN